MASPRSTTARSCTLAAVLVTTLAQIAPAPAQDAFRYQVRTIAQDFARPMGFDLLPDGRAIVIELSGTVLLVDTATGARVAAGELEVFDQQENGLLGVALAPDFAATRHVYLLYSPPDEVGQRISRFELSADRLDMDSETIVIRWPTQRRECCHHGGMLLFGPDGCLYASCGDNTHPFGDSHSYAPIDRRAGRDPWNAEKSSANPADLRGGIIRIRPLPDGGYAIPDGNLFPAGMPGTRPEIYVMGCRNPWKISIDPKTGYLYWGDVGPDARADGDRGPRGYDELNQARGPGFFGWPYFIADNRAYAFVDFATQTIGERFDPARPVNASPWNTGRTELPPAQPAFVYWPYAGSERWPGLGTGGRTACAGPVFHFEPSFEQSDGLPRQLDNCLLFWDWNRPFIKWARLDENSDLVAIEDFGVPVELQRPSNAKFGPDGTLYLLDYGATWHANQDAKLVHIRYRRGNLDPSARIGATPLHGAVPLSVTLDGSGSNDPESAPLGYRWLRQPGDVLVASGERAVVTFDEPGDHTIQLEVRDPGGATATATVVIVAGNSSPAVSIEAPRDGSFYEPGQPIPFELRVVDAEDGDSRQAVGPFAATVVTLSERRRESPGLAAIRASDCFNCHHVSQRLVGPAFVEVAERYRGDDAAFERSVQRVLNGSTNEWGPAPMLPHTQLTLRQAESMVRWIFDLDRESTPTVARGVRGELTAPAGGSLELSANYTDASPEGVSSLSGGASIRLHPTTLQAESFDSNNGTQTLEDGDTRFLGAINHSHWVEWERIRIGDCRAVTARVASAGAGGHIRLHVGDATVAEIFVEPTGGWDRWQQIQVPIEPLPTEQVPAGAVTLRATFVNPGNQALMNLDWLRFETR